MAPIFRILGPLEVEGAGPLGGARAHRDGAGNRRSASPVRFRVTG